MKAFAFIALLICVTSCNNINNKNNMLDNITGKLDSAVVFSKERIEIHTDELEDSLVIIFYDTSEYPTSDYVNLKFSYAVYTIFNDLNFRDFKTIQCSDFLVNYTNNTRKDLYIYTKYMNIYDAKYDIEMYNSNPEFKYFAELTLRNLTEYDVFISNLFLTDELEEPPKNKIDSSLIYQANDFYLNCEDTILSKNDYRRLQSLAAVYLVYSPNKISNYVNALFKKCGYPIVYDTSFALIEPKFSYFSHK